MKSNKYSFLAELGTLTMLENMRKSSWEIDKSLLSNEYISLRKSLLYLLKEYTIKLKFKSQTYFLAVKFLDRVISDSSTFCRKDYDLIAISCLIISAKYCENDPAIPNLSNFQCVSPKHYFSLESLKRAEVAALIVLQHDIHVFTIYNFFVFILGMGVLFEDDFRVIQQEPKIQEDFKFVREESAPLSQNSTKNSPTTVEDTREDLVSLSDKVASHGKSLLDIVISDSEIIGSCDFLCAVGIAMLSRENMKFSPWNDHFEKVLGVDFNTASHYYELVRNSVSKYFRTKSVRVYTTSKPKNSQTLLSVGSFSPSDNLNKVNKEIPIDLSSGIGNFQNSGIHNVDRIQSKMNDIKDLINNFDKPSYLDNRKEPQVEDVERVRNKSIGPSFKSSSLVLEKRNSNAYECRKGESNLVWNEAKRPYIYSFNDSYRIPSIPEENLPRDNTSNKQAARDNTRVSIPIEINDQANSDLISRTRKIFSNSSTKEIDLSAKIIQNYNPGYIVKRPKHSEFNFDYSKSAKFYEEDSSHRPDSSEYITYSNSSKLNFIDQTGKYGDHLNNYGGSYARDADLFQYKDKELLKKSDDYTVYHRRSNYGICDRLSEVSSKPVKNLHSTKNICNEYLRNNSELSYDIGSNPLMNSQGLKHIYKS